MKDIFNGHDIIIELNSNEINLLQTKPVYEKSYYETDEVAGTRYYFISYNENYIETNLDSIWDEFNNKVILLKKQNKYKEINNKYLEMKLHCRAFKIIVFLKADII